MDRFLIRTPNPTWRSSDTSFTRSFANKSFTDKKSTPKCDAKLRRLSIRDETLLKIFSSQPDQPLNDENVNPIALFRSISQPAKTTDVDNDSPKAKGAFAANCHSVADRTAHESADAQDLEVMAMTPPTDVAPSSAENVFPHDKALQTRLQRDLNSPSANARVRAMKALRSPAKTGYCNFDVPHEEQDIITDEERSRPESIQEVMKTVVVYVEVRTAEDNRSAGVKNVISQLGAKVNDRFLRDTTHVVFKDGLQSTYNKAKKWNIPIVSILWIEACKNHMVLMNPKLYPISNIERYENPELFTKLKRQKSMQPNAEENIRRHKVKLLAGANKKTETEKEAVKPATKISIPRKPKDNLGDILSDFKEKLLSTPECTEDIIKPDSKVLERLQNSPYITKNKTKQKTTTNSLKKFPMFRSNIAEENSDDDFEVPKLATITPEVNAKKTLLFDEKITTSETKRKSTATSSTKRRATIMPKVKSPTCQPASTTTPISTINNPDTMPKTPASQRKVQSSRITRRSSMSLVENTTSTSITKEGSVSINKTVIMEESCDIDGNTGYDGHTEGASAKNRETTYADVQLEITKNPLNNNTITPDITANRRRTLFACKPTEETSVDPEKVPERKESTTRRRTCFNFPSYEANSPNPTGQSPSKASKTADIEGYNEVSDNCLPSIRKSVRRRTMFTPSYRDEVNETVQDATTLNASCALKPVNLFGSETPTAKPGTIIEELNSSLTFNSTKTPINPRRRTIYDISMDIIDKRLENINKSAKQNRYTEFRPREDVEKLVDNECIVADSTKSRENPSDEISKTNNRHTTIDSFTAILNGDSFKTSTKLGLNDSTTSQTPAQPKKRKLFAPVELLFSTPPASSTAQKDKVNADELDGNPKKKAKTENKPIKSVKRINGTAKKANGASATSRSQSRRSTLDFEQVEKFRTMKSVQHTKPAPVGKLNHMVCTNMHTEQMNFIKQAIGKLGGFKLENTVSANTTHVVSLESRRTFNLLRGIIHGLWILNYNWILESVENGKWLYEEPYEMISFSRGVEICRSQRQAFGPKFKMDLFTDLPPVYVSPQSNVPAQNVEELISLCSGKITKDKNDAKYVLGETLRDNPDKICLNPIWILDCIQDNQIKKMTKYILAG